MRLFVHTSCNYMQRKYIQLNSISLKFKDSKATSKFGTEMIKIKDMVKGS